MGSPGAPLLGLFTKGGCFSRPLAALKLRRSAFRCVSLPGCVVTAVPSLRLAAIEPALLPLVRLMASAARSLACRRLSVQPISNACWPGARCPRWAWCFPPAAGGALALTHGLASTPVSHGRATGSASSRNGAPVLPQSVDTAVAGSSQCCLPGMAGLPPKTRRSDPCVGLEPHPDRQRQRRRLCPPLVTRAGAIQLLPQGFLQAQPCS